MVRSRPAAGPPPPPRIQRPPHLRRAPGQLARWTAAAVAGTALGLLGAAIGLEYVGARVFSVLWPAMVGAVCGGAAVAVVRRPWAPRLLAAGYGALAAAYAFRFAQTPFGPVGRWLPPLLAGAAGPFALPAADRLIRALDRRPPREAGPD